MCPVAPGIALFTQGLDLQNRFIHVGCIDNIRKSSLYTVYLIGCC